MRKFLIVVLRIFVLLLLLIPVLFPSVNVPAVKKSKETISIYIPVERKSDLAFQLEVKKGVAQSLDLSKTDIFWKIYGLADLEHPATRYQDLLVQIAEQKGLGIVVPTWGVWNSVVHAVNTKIQNSLAFKEKRLFLYDDSSNANQGGVGQSSIDQNNILGIVDIFLPKISFLGEEISLSIDIQGKMEVPEHSAEVVVYLDESILTSKMVEIHSDKNQIVNQIINIPVRFAKAGSQTLTVSLNSTFANLPLNVATTSTHIQHQKTTMLHVAVGPDWSLRTLRQKLKFWPNLDLLSYYILREATDDPRISSNQLSLIEFPSEKLFGEQLPSFHGVIAQNFDFDQYLNAQDADNLLKYVQQGGRLVIHSGPHSFPNLSSKLSELLPCVNVPSFDFKTEYNWEAADSQFSESGSRSGSHADLFSGITSKNSAIGCEPKSGSLVLARTLEGKHPMLVAYPVGKGLVATFLSNDWHLGYLSQESQNAIQGSKKVKKALNSDALFAWMMEFLQRRQDGGLRPPEIDTPRFYLQDNIYLIKARGLLLLGEEFQLEKDSSKLGSGFSSRLNALDLDVFLKDAKGLSLGGGKEISSESQNRVAVERPKNSDVVLRFLDSKKASGVSRFGTQQRPVFEGTSGRSENFKNPNVLVNLPVLNNGAGSKSASEVKNQPFEQQTPILEVYPFLVALALGIFCLEQILTLFFVKPVRASVRIHEKNKM